MPLSPAEASGSINPILSDAFNSSSLDKFKWFGEFVCPTMLNNGELSGQISSYSTDAVKLDDDTHAVGKPANLLDLSHRTFQSYTLLPHSLSVEQSSMEDKRLRQGGTDPDRELLRRIEALKLKLAINEARAQYTLISTTGNYEDSTQYPAAGDAWTADAADPVDQVLSLKRAIRAIRNIDPNCMCLNKHAADLARSRAATIARLGSDRLKVVTNEDLRMLFEIDELTITDAVYDTTAATVAASFSYIWGAIACLFYKPPVLDMYGVDGWEFARTIRSENSPAEVYTSANDPAKAPEKGSSYYYIHTVKAGLYVPKMICVNSGSDPDSLVGGILTGLYS